MSISHRAKVNTSETLEGLTFREVKPIRIHLVGFRSVYCGIQYKPYEERKHQDVI